jgi:hypothetical protein
MLNCATVKLLEKDSIVPAGFDGGYFVACLLAYILRVYIHGHLHYLQGIRFHEKGKSIPAHFFACEFFASDDTVRSCL